MKKIYLAFLALSLLFSGCVKDCPYHLLPDSVKPFLFKQNSQWVFSNPISGVNDTFIVVRYHSEITHGATPNKCRGSATNELFEMTVVNRLDTFRVYAYGSSFLRLAKTDYSIQATIFDSSIPSGSCSKFDDRLCLTDISSLTVGSNTFNEASQIVTTIVDQNGSELFTSDMFWVKNIGIVKVIRHDSNLTTFNLVSWSVVQ